MALGPVQLGAAVLIHRLEPEEPESRAQRMQEKIFQHCNKVVLTVNAFDKEYENLHKMFAHCNHT